MRLIRIQQLFSNSERRAWSGALLWIVFYIDVTTPVGIGNYKPSNIQHVMDAHYKVRLSYIGKVTRAGLFYFKVNSERNVRGILRGRSW